MSGQERRQARAERQAAALLVVLAPIVVLGVLGWVAVILALFAPDCVPDAAQPVCYWSGAGDDALQVSGMTVWSWENAAWRWEDARP